MIANPWRWMSAWLVALCLVGQYRVRLMDNTQGGDCAYPGVEVPPDGTIVCTTSGHWARGEEPYIVAVRLKLDELDARARATVP